MIISNPFIIFVLGLSMLIYGADVLINNSKNVAYKFNISKTIIGITVVAFGTSFPELIISIFAAIKNDTSIIMGNIIGSNIANIGLVLGVSGFIYPIIIKSNVNRMRYNMAFLFVSTISLIFGLIINIINIYYGIFLLLLFYVYIFYLFKYFLKDDDDETHIDRDDIKHYSLIYLFFFICFGFVLVSLGSDFFIKGTIGISRYFGYDNNLIISMTLVALGTSLPELVTSIVAIKKGETRMAVGNIIGSNIINILLVIGVCSIISNTFIFDFSSIHFHLTILLIITLALIFITLFYKKINRMVCLFFIILYTIFIYVNFI